MLLLLACTSPEVDDDSQYVPGELPDWLPSPSVEVDAPESEGGAIIAGIIQTGESAVVIVERDGTITWASELAERAVPSWVELTDGDLIVYNEHHRDRHSAGGDVIAVRLSTGEVITTAAPYGHHSGSINGDTLAYVKAEFREMEWEGEMVSVAADALVIRNLGDQEGEGKTLFSFFDDWTGELFSPCRHFDNDLYYQTAKDWTHVNSLLELEDVYVMEARHWDSFLAIDKDSGEIAWIMGGDYSDWTAGDRTMPWSHPHVSKMSEELIVMFDNGDHKEPPHSRAVVYDLDMDEKIYTERFRIPEQDSNFLPLLGDAQLLPGGNILVSWTELGRIDEYTPDGELVWRLELPLGTIVSRVDHIP